MVLANLQDIRAELLESIEGLSDSQLNEAPQGGGWTIAQVMLHLEQIELSLLKIAKKGLEDSQGEAKIRDLSIVADRSKKSEAPFQPPSEPMTRDELLARLEESREQVALFLNGTDPVDLEGKSAKNPVFGKLTVKQTIEFIGAHESRHIGQIEEIKSQLAHAGA